MKAMYCISFRILHPITFITGKVCFLLVDGQYAVQDPLVDRLMSLKSTLVQLLSEHLDNVDIEHQEEILLRFDKVTCLAWVKSAFAPDLIAALRRICRKISF